MTAGVIGAAAAFIGLTAGAGASASAPPPATEFDECSLLPPDELAGYLGVEAVYITGRSAAPSSIGEWNTACWYSVRDVPGVGGMSVQITNGTDEERFFAPFAGREHAGELDGLGDRAALSQLSSAETGLHQTELRVITGTVGLYVAYWHTEGGSGMPPVEPESFGVLAAAAVDRIPAEVVIADWRAVAPCTSIDPAQASTTLGAEVVGSRSVVHDDGALVCFLGADTATLEVIVLSDPDSVAAQRPAPEELNVADVGDGAMVNVVPPDAAGSSGRLHATIVVGERLVVVTGSYGPAVASTLQAGPRPDDIALLTSILAAVAP